MERTLLLVSIFALSLSTHSAERLKLKFKDGTTLNGAEIYVPTIGNSTGNPNGYGVILKYSNKLYFDLKNETDWLNYNIKLNWLNRTNISLLIYTL